MSSTPPGPQGIQFALGVTNDGEVLVGKVNVNHLLFTPDEALHMAEGLIEAAKMAAAGRSDILRRA